MELNLASDQQDGPNVLTDVLKLVEEQPKELLELAEQNEQLEGQSAGDGEEPVEDTIMLEKCGILESQPQQNTFEFSNGLVISSEFDSGNLKSCI